MIQLWKNRASSISDAGGKPLVAVKPNVFQGGFKAQFDLRDHFAP